MQALDFLNIVLPTQGRRAIGRLRQGQFQNLFGGSNAWAERAAFTIDAAGVDTYFALGGFDGAQKRKQENVLYLRSFWVDLDTKEGKPKAIYPTRKDALIALDYTVKTMGLPAPLVVSSGYGLHAYWPCEDDIPASDWTATAVMFKAALRQAKLDADPSRTADSASVLRVPGTHNYKHGTSKVIKVIAKGEITTHEAFRKAVMEYAGLSAFDMQAAPSHSQQTINNDLMMPVNKVPSDAHKIADNCAVIDLLRQTKGNVDQPTWFHGLGVLAFTEQGEEICHDWSDGHPKYSQRETAAKVSQVLKFAPTSCSKLSEHQPHLCEVCPHFGKIKSPIVLGTPRSNPKPVVPKTDAERIVKVDLSDDNYPKGFGWGPVDTTDKTSPDVLYYVTVKDVDGLPVKERHLLSEVRFRPLSRVRSNEDAYSMQIWMEDKTGNQRSFVINHSLIAEGGSPLLGELGKREVAVELGDRVHLQRYLNGWIGKLRDEFASTPSIEQYGWHNDGFIVGPRYYTPTHEGSAILVGSAQSYGKHMHKAGTLDAWVQAVDRAYNRPGEEALQFCVLTAFAAPLYSLFGDNGGVTVYAHSDSSGFGKTTAQQVGLSAWGFYPELILRENNFTEGALYQHMGVMKNLPIVIDEMTNCTPDFASKLVYNMSAGKGKSRMNADASMKKSLNWSTIAAASGNKLLSEKLAAFRTNAEAELMRVWEFTLTHRSTITPNEAQQIFPLFLQNYGHAGEVFINYVTKNREAVIASMARTRQQFNTRANIGQAERYWSALHTCILTSLGICRQLGLLQFDMKGMLRWIMSELDAQRGTVTQSVTDPLEQFGKMLMDIWSGMLVTVGEGNASQKAYATVLQPKPHGAITGRSILPDALTAEKLYISTASARDWCNKKNASFKAMHEALVAAGVADPNIKRVALGKGTEEYSGLNSPVKCWDINPAVFRSMTGNLPIAAKIRAVHNGGAGVALNPTGTI